MMLYEKLKTIKKKEVQGFLIGGTSAVLVDYATYLIFMHIGFDMSMSKAISYVLGAVVGFVINKYWAFDCRKFSSGEIIRYIVLYAFTAGANTLTNYAVLLICSWTIFAFLCATGVSTILNFIGQKFIVFKK